MEAFGDLAVRATELVRNGTYESAADTWEAEAKSVFPHSPSQQDKNCPKGAFLGLCEEGMVAGVPIGRYTRSRDNKEYAVGAAKLLAVEPELASGSATALWERVMSGRSKVHNSQMDVVLALYRRGFLVIDRPHSE